MPLKERSKIWVPWTDNERRGGIDFQHVLTRKWRDRYAALRERHAIHPHFKLDSIVSGAYQQVGTVKGYIRIPRYARFLLCRCLAQYEWDGVTVNTNFITRITVGTYTASVFRGFVHEDAEPPPIETVWDGTHQDHAGITWFNTTPIIPAPYNYPNGFADTDWDTDLEVKYELAGSTGNTAIKLNADQRVWSWITEDVVPDITIWDKEPSEYA